MTTDAWPFIRKSGLDLLKLVGLSHLKRVTKLIVAFDWRNNAAGQIRIEKVVCGENGRPSIDDGCSMREHAEFAWRPGPIDIKWVPGELPDEN